MRASLHFLVLCGALGLVLLSSIAAAGEEGGGRIAQVVIEGKTLEASDRLARFLGLTSGATFDRARVEEALAAIGYHVVSLDAQPSPDGLRVRLKIETARLVRHIRVKGNWPVLRAIFNEDIMRRLSLRPGSRLPPGDLRPLLERESERVREYLRREGFFQADAAVVAVPAGKPEWLDLKVLIYLGRWFTLGDVIADGAHALNHKQLADPFIHNFPPSYWSRFRVDQLHEDVRKAEALYRDHGYPAARIFSDFDPKLDVDQAAGKVRLRLRVTEKGKVQLHFVGNHALDDKTLMQKVTIFSSASYDETELVESAKEIHRAYQARGYLQANVTFRHQRSAGVHDITFFIDEGPQLKVRAVQFVPEPGTAPLSFPPAVLKSKIATKVFPLIGEIGLGEGGYVTSVQLAQDADKLAAYYRAQGFPAVRVRGEVARDAATLGAMGAIAAQVTADWGKGDDLYVRFYIDEGRREKVGTIEFRFKDAATAAHEKDLRRVLDLAAGATFSPEVLGAAFKRLLDRLRSHGHPYAAIDASGSTWDEAHARVHLKIDVDAGDEVRFGEILVRGNFRTAEWAIRADLPFRTGDVFDQTKLALAERNLQTHTIFNSVRVTTVPTVLQVGTNPIPILIEVQERYDNWGNIEAAIGYATDLGATASLGYFWGNFFGTGTQLELRFDVAADIFGQTWTTNVDAPFWRLLGGTVRYITPHLGIPSLRGEVWGFLRKESTVGLGEVITGGFRLAVTWTPALAWRLFGRFDLTKSSLQSIEYQHLPGRGDTVSTIPDATRIGKLTFGAVFDDRVSFDGAKNPLMPVSGWLLALQAAVSAEPVSTHNFIVVSGQAQRYQRLGKGVSLIANLRCDWGIPLGEPALPAVERFFAGGDTSTRGYGTDMLRTEVIRGNVSPAPTDAAFRVIAQGGNIRVLGTLELQFPIGKLASFPWVGAIFFDVGTIFDHADLFDFRRDVKTSIGVTVLRLLTPVGPLSLEYAYPLNQSLAEELWKRDSIIHWPGRIHFNWGIPILR